MAENKRSIPINPLRRQDRAKDEAWIKNFLQRAPQGVLAIASGGQPLLHFNLFAYDETAQAIYIHTATEGRTPASLSADGRLCFGASEMGRLIPSPNARGFSVEFASVIVFGRAVLVTEEAEIHHGLQLLMRKYYPHLRTGMDYPLPGPQDLEGMAVFRIVIESWSGKQKIVEPDYPGAFFYGEWPEPNPSE